MCECGDNLEACRSAWDDCLVVEFADPEYGVVHHFTVAAFMLQHPSRLSASGWDEIAALLRRFVAGLTPEAARREVGARRREQSLVRGVSRDLDGLTWTRRVSGVRRETPKVYGDDIRAWAEATLADIDRFAPHL